MPDRYYEYKVHYQNENGHPLCGMAADFTTTDVEQITCGNCLRTDLVRKLAGLEGLRASQAAALITHHRQVRVIRSNAFYQVWAGRHLIFKHRDLQAIQDFITRYRLTINHTLTEDTPNER